MLNPRTAQNELADLYQADSRPWVVGYSGGKDSTALLQLVFQTLIQLQETTRTKPVHVVCNDTQVEIPNVVSMVSDGLLTAARKLGLPITVGQTRPERDQTFFVNIIGRGYPFIGGENGFGKTTLLNAIKLCLYGRRASELKSATSP